MAKLSTLDALRLALEHHKAGNLPAAEQVYRKVLVHDPNNADALHLLGYLLRETGRVRTGIDLLVRAVEKNPNIAQFHNHLGQALRDLGRAEEAVESFRTAIGLDPNYAEAHNNLGSALHDLRLIPQAVTSFRKAIALAPEMPDAHGNLGSALLDLARVDEAAGACREAIRANPNFAPAYNNLANCLCEQGLADDAIAEYRKAIAAGPWFQIAWSNFLFTLHTSTKYDGRAILNEHKEWAKLCASPFAAAAHIFANERNPDRKLKIGYVSPDFRDHPVGRFLLPLLEHHDRAQFEIHCFADVLVNDDYTNRLRAHADATGGGWHVTATLNDNELADLVRHHHIDLLIDLRLHSSPNRLLVFARKPAPVQISYLGYPGTTGLTTMDYRLTDAYLDPPSPSLSGRGQGEGASNDRTAFFYTEQSLRLPGPYWCYQPHASSPEVAPLPAEKNGFVTFGCLNGFTKVSPLAVDLWRQILLANPTSRLLLQALPGSHRDRLRNQFAQHQIDPNRLDFIGKLSFPDYLAAYARIDLALDTLPFPGGVTTCDALWMGVPTITLAGQTATQRSGVSILTAATLPEFIANSPADYVRIATTWSHDIARLSSLRAQLRRKLAASTLMDATAYAHRIEQTYRQAWRNFCARR